MYLPDVFDIISSGGFVNTASSLRLTRLSSGAIIIADEKQSSAYYSVYI